MPFPSSVPNTLEAFRAHATESHLGTALCCNSTSLLTTPGVFHCPRSWIDTYYPIPNTGLDRTSERLDNGGVPIRSAELVEDAGFTDSPSVQAYVSLIFGAVLFTANRDVEAWKQIEIASVS